MTNHGNLRRERVIFALDAGLVAYYINVVTKIEAYRQAMLARKAAAAGISVEELLRRGEAQAALNHRVWELRANRASGWAAIARKAAAHRRTWEVL